ncbi:unnamed protein product [Prorocentrum cordatum]|uniref:Uncharacterized protein n=1 Tax=Prorocentrum cordatum TaxID=2364126 RepID=A0ABN9QZU7_9DINO|nr:unnamed protein product [Polarella glacialis]
MARDGLLHGARGRSRAERSAACWRAREAADAAVAKLSSRLADAQGLIPALELDLDVVAPGFGGGELKRRLRLIMPVLAAGIAGVRAAGSARARRNLAAHNFDISAEIIGGASQRELNQLQRAGRSGSACAAVGAAGGGAALRAEAPVFFPGAEHWEPLRDQALAVTGLRCHCGTVVFSSWEPIVLDGGAFAVNHLSEENGDGSNGSVVKENAEADTLSAGSGFVASDLPTGGVPPPPPVDGSEEGIAATDGAQVIAQEVPDTGEGVFPERGLGDKGGVLSPLVSAFGRGGGVRGVPFTIAPGACRKECNDLDGEDRSAGSSGYRDRRGDPVKNRKNEVVRRSLGNSDPGLKAPPCAVSKTSGIGPPRKVECQQQ